MRRIFAVLILLAILFTAGYLIYNIDHQSDTMDDESDAVESVY